MGAIMDLGISELRVLVTAEANGIGRGIARAFVREGALVHVCDVDQKELTKLARTLPGTPLICSSRKPKHPFSSFLKILETLKPRCNFDDT
jgi:short-subunit dehydrogenase involved in D-alanine esterification of teichoic acids